MSDSWPQASSIRVLLVDDNPMLRQALRSALEAHANIEVAGEASDGEEALVCVAKLQPTAVVMDINLPKMDGITATRLIKVGYPEVAVVGISVETKDYLVYSMQKAGASEVVDKEHVVALYGAIQRAVAAVKPIVIMQETPVSNQAPSDSHPSETKESTSKTQPGERPTRNEEKVPAQESTVRGKNSF
jgi:DNA-binding NarL/FixJ family response regulator